MSNEGDNVKRNKMQIDPVTEYRVMSCDGTFKLIRQKNVISGIKTFPLIIINNNHVTRCEEKTLLLIRQLSDTSDKPSN